MTGKLLPSSSMWVRKALGKVLNSWCATAWLRRMKPPRFSSKVYAGSGHNETDWQRNLHEPLRMLLGT